MNIYTLEISRLQADGEVMDFRTKVLAETRLTALVDAQEKFLERLQENYKIIASGMNVGFDGAVRNFIIGNDKGEIKDYIVRIVKEER